MTLNKDVFLVAGLELLQRLFGSLTRPAPIHVDEGESNHLDRRAVLNLCHSSSPLFEKNQRAFTKSPVPRPAGEDPLFVRELCDYFFDFFDLRALRAPPMPHASRAFAAAALRAAAEAP
jgi:hypothetical protein